MSDLLNNSWNEYACYRVDSHLLIIIFCDLFAIYSCIISRYKTTVYLHCLPTKLFNTSAFSQFANYKT